MNARQRAVLLLYQEEMMFTLLSYPLGPQTPTYGKNPPMVVTPVSQIATGGVANWFVFETINHNGTHIDAPYHFHDQGKRLTDLDINEFVFGFPTIVDIPKHDGELITVHDLEVHHSGMAQADLVLIRTGWAAACRSSDPVRYGGQAPGFAASAGWYFIEKLPQVRAIAMDLPSAASPASARGNEEGLEFHRIVLGAYGNEQGRYILLIEDARIEPTLRSEQIQRVIVAPLWLEDLDGAPVTILAEQRDAYHGEKGGVTWIQS